MVPQFPEFKTLELSDAPAVGHFTSAHKAYSDYDFTSLWSWNVKNEVQISTLNDNLIIRFSDYATGTPFLSCIGTSKVNETFSALSAYARTAGLEVSFALVPEETAMLVDQSEFVVEEDRDHFDYIYSTALWSTFEGGAFARKRNEVHSLLDAHPDITAVELDIHDPAVRAQMQALYTQWIELKTASGEEYEVNEGLAFNRVFDVIDSVTFVTAGLMLDGALVAFCMSTVGSNGCAVGHFAKADSRIRGTNAFLMQSLAQFLNKKGIGCFNYEQDLGKENLRQAKERFRPVDFYKKYKVRPI